MNLEEYVISLNVANLLHDQGYITDEAYERYKQDLAAKIIEEHENRKPWWRIW
ncbi:hypothetical protein M0R72_15855 [Candidatus Pacearchaeota archaeon]|jgi:hypothetical protein|nr:hypothetical protein [Candidatus Pacearchaeota archaeon]